MKEIELWSGLRGDGYWNPGKVGFSGEFLGVVDIARNEDWVERCAIYRAEGGRVVVHHMRLSTGEKWRDVAEVYMLPLLDAGERED